MLRPVESSPLGSSEAVNLQLLYSQLCNFRSNVFNWRVESAPRDVSLAVWRWMETYGKKSSTSVNR